LSAFLSHRWRSAAAAFALGTIALVLLMTTGGAARAGSTIVSPAGDPFVGRHLYLDPNSPARLAATAMRATNPAGAGALDLVASQSSADWFGGWNSTATVAATIRSRVAQETAAGDYPVLVVYNIPALDCSAYGTSGAANAAAYQAWLKQVEAGIGTSSVAVIVEPDALAGLSCLTSAQQTERLSLIKWDAQTLSALGHAAVYLDAGNAGWQPASVMSNRLNSAGVYYARGFSLNVSNYDSTASEMAYGREIASGSGWKHYVVDTGRNGLGSNGQWCNASGRALGDRPTAKTNDDLADALLWIKPPGESDGTCNGGPTAGTFWSDYAIGLAQRASW